MRNVLIVGGGPSGCAAGITLAKTGVPVCLLERKTSTHDKVCGEFINSDAARLLAELGIDLAALGAQPIRYLSLCCAANKLSCDLPEPAWSLSRRVLDAHLLAKAKQAGVEVHTGITVKDIHRTDHGWELLTSSHTSFSDQRELRSVHARTLFLATGKHDVHNWQRPYENPANGELIGLKMHLQLHHAQWDALQKTVEMYFYDDGYAGLEPIEHGKANLCLLMKRSIYKGCGGHWQGIINWLGTTSPHLKERLAEAEALWPKPLAISSVPYGYLHSSQAVPPDFFRVGDQAAVIHSLAGDGIAIALHSGKLAARVFKEAGPPSEYYRQARALFEKPITNAQRIATLMSSTIGRHTAFFFLRHWPSLALAAMARVRLNR